MPKKETLMERCDGYDYSLVYSAKLSLTKPNKFVCCCIHCRQQAVTKDAIKHVTDCCFFGKTNRK